MRFPRAVALCLLLASCARRAPLYDGPPIEPVPIEAPPEPVFGPDDHHLNRPKEPPVFGEQAPTPEREPSSEPGIPLGPPGIRAMEEIIWGATLQRECLDCEEHHLFPRQEGLRDRFERREIRVDEWAILIPKDQHRRAHRREGGDYGPGGKWNWDWDQWWRRRKGLQTSTDDIFIRAQEMIREHKLNPYGLPIQYGHGRAISRDLYDIVQPPREVP